MNIDMMPAGQEMDKLVAEKVIGLETELFITPMHEDLLYFDADRILCHVPRYSTSLAAAWQVVEKLTANNNGYFELHKDFGGWFTASFAIILSKDDERRKLGYGNWEYESEGNDTAPLAICRAALKAVLP